MELFGVYKTDDEFLQKAQEYINEFDNEQVIIWGAGKLVKKFLEISQGNIDVKYIVDSNKNLQGTDFYGYKVYSPEKILGENTKKLKMIITPMTYHKYEIAEYLLDIGLQDEDFVFLYDFIILFAYMYQDKLVLPFLDLIVQNACTLKCKNCLAFVPQSKRTFIPLKMISKQIDIIFSKIDFINSFSISTGEVLLHPNLIDILKLVCSKRNQFEEFRFITNGTILPSEKTLLALQECSQYIYVYISDYSSQVGNKSKIEELMNLFDKYNINYNYNHILAGSSNMWNDFWSTKELKRKKIQSLKLYQKCADHTCSVSFEEKIFPCAPAAYAAFNNITNLAHDRKNYIDVNSSKLEFIRFFLRATSYGAPPICDMCYGMGPLVNKKLVPAGEQIKS